MFIVVGKKVLYPVGLSKTALLIKKNGRRGVTGAHKHRLAIGVKVEYKIYQRFPVAFSLAVGLYRDVLRPRAPAARRAAGH